MLKKAHVEVGQHVTDIARRKEILVVDDYVLNADIMVELLSRDYEVSVALDGESALEHVENYVPDLILLDVVLPGIDGFEVFRRLRARTATRLVPVIFLSGMTDIAEMAPDLDLSSAGHLAKPFRPNDLLASVRAIFCP